MNKVWQVRADACDGNFVLYTCATEELAMEYLRAEAKTQEVRMIEMREHILKNDFGSEDRRQARADEWIVTWDGDDYFSTPLYSYSINWVDVLDGGP